MDQRINNLDHVLAEDLSLDPVVFDQLRAAQRELGLVYGDRPTCPFLRPYILNRRQYDEVKSAAEIIAHAFEKVANQALIDKKLMALLCPTPLEEEMARMGKSRAGWLRTSERNPDQPMRMTREKRLQGRELRHCLQASRHS